MGASEKRKDYISWDEYFMGIAMLSGMRSKDPNTQVGACIVDPEHKILSMGYNGFPLGCSDDEFTWAREGEDNKYFYSTHSELNAILNYRGGSLEGATIYVTLFPCNECAKAIIQSGIREVVYDCDKYEGTAETIRKILLTCATKMRSIFAAPIYIFSKTEKYANSGIRPSTSCILRMPFPGQRRIVKSEITSMTAYP